MPEAADFAGRSAADVWRGRYLEWMETSLPRTTTDLLARLPFDDAVKLAALVGTGRMTWPEINAALDALIKLAATDVLDGQGAERYLPPTRHAPKRIAEDEIWARYHAQCDEVFANDAGPTDMGAWSEQLWHTERILDRLRSARDRELAALRRRLGAQPPAPSGIRLTPSQAAVPWTELSPAESAALDQLEATGFIGSQGMIAAIDDLVGEIAAGRSSGAQSMASPVICGDR